MNYSSVFGHEKKAIKFEEIKDLDFVIKNYIMYIEISPRAPRADNSGLDDIQRHYLIEMENSSGETGIYEISISSVWDSMKNYLKVGEKVKATGFKLCDETGNLIYIDIQTFEYSDIKFSKNAITSKYGTADVGRVLIEFKNNKITIKNKFVTAMLLVLLLALILSTISLIFLVIFLIDALTLVIYSSIKNKDSRVDIEDIFLNSNIEKVEQKYLEVTKEYKGFMVQPDYKEIYKL